MEKTIKRVLEITATTVGVAAATMAITNKYVDYKSQKNHLTTGKADHYYIWRHGEICYTKKGKGKPILLIHDLDPMSSHYEWTKVMDKLEGRTVYTIDLIGCGKSDKPAFTYVNYMYVQLVSDFIKNIIGEKTDIVTTGDSFSFVVMASRMNPNLIGKIYAINPADTNHTVKSPKKLGEFKKKFLDVPLLGKFTYNLITTENTVTSLFNKIYYQDYINEESKIKDVYYESAHYNKSNGKNLYGSILGNYTSINIIHALKLIENDITFILTEGYEGAEEYIKYNPKIKLINIADSGYLPQLEKPEEVIEIIK